MGRFSVTTVLHNRENFSREKFTELFCEKMQERGYISTDKENSDLYHVIAFSENLKWITLISDSASMAQCLNMDCIRIEVVDSDFVTLDMCSATGETIESFIMGAPYWDEDENEQMGYSKPTEKVWGGLLEDGYSWEKFVEVCNEDSVFAESLLEEVAEMTGMNIHHIMLSEGHIEEECEYLKDDNIFFLYFKRA